MVKISSFYLAATLAVSLTDALPLERKATSEFELDEREPEPFFFLAPLISTAARVGIQAGARAGAKAGSHVAKEKAKEKINNHRKKDEIIDPIPEVGAREPEPEPFFFLAPLISTAARVGIQAGARAGAKAGSHVAKEKAKEKINKHRKKDEIIGELEDLE